jgi:site-specific DNA-methyltransferase (adenine-specific)
MPTDQPTLAVIMPRPNSQTGTVDGESRSRLAWQDEHSRLYLADVVDGLNVVPDGSVDLVVTSPPYNLGGFGGRNGRKNAKWPQAALATGYEQNTDAMDPAEYRRWLGEVMELIWQKVSPTGALMLVHKQRVLAGRVTLPTDFIPGGLPIRQVVPWSIGTGMNVNVGAFASTHEWLVIVAGRRWRLRSPRASSIGDFWRLPRGPHNPYPGSFPLSLPLRAIDATTAEVILDPFFGSGTTLIAARRLGRYGIGIDSSARALAIARERIERQPWKEPTDRHPKKCTECGERYRPQRSDGRYCSTTCRQRAWRRSRPS